MKTLQELWDKIEALQAEVSAQSAVLNVLQAVVDPPLCDGDVAGG